MQLSISINYIKNKIKNILTIRISLEIYIIVRLMIFNMNGVAVLTFMHEVLKLGF